MNIKPLMPHATWVEQQSAPSTAHSFSSYLNDERYWQHQSSLQHSNLTFEENIPSQSAQVPLDSQEESSQAMDALSLERKQPLQLRFNPLKHALQRQNASPSLAPIHPKPNFTHEITRSIAPHILPMEKNVLGVDKSTRRISRKTADTPAHRLGVYYHQKNGIAELALVCKAHDQKWHHLIKHRVMDWLAQKGIKLKALWINGVRQ